MPPQSLGAAIASFGRCFDFIPSLLIARAIDKGLKCAVGTTISTRRDALISYGGLHLNRIGSDYNIGKRAAQQAMLWNCLAMCWSQTQAQKALAMCISGSYAGREPFALTGAHSIIQ